MARGSKSGGGPGTVSLGSGKTSITSTMKPVFSKGKGRQSAKRLQRRPMTGR